MGLRWLWVVILGGCIVQPQPDPPLSAGDDDVGDRDGGAADGDVDSDSDADSDTDTQSDIDAECAPEAGEIVTLTTEDGLALAADFYGAGPDAPAAVLFHMHPPSGFNRTDWPADFIASFVSTGISVLNVDRRGAGDSEGDPDDAVGPNGLLDAKAAYDFLSAQSCAVDTTRLAWIGASNGTAVVFDFTLAAADDAAIDDAAALVFLTGGAYTESQNLFADHRDVLDRAPILFTYQGSESDWSAQFETDAPAGWVFAEALGGHGTDMLTLDPTIGSTIVAFSAGPLGL